MPTKRVSWSMGAPAKKKDGHSRAFFAWDFFHLLRGRVERHVSELLASPPPPFEMFFLVRLILPRKERRRVGPRSSLLGVVTRLSSLCSGFVGSLAVPGDRFCRPSHHSSFAL